MNTKSDHKTENFCLALSSLEKALSEKPTREVEIAGIIQMFEYTYETAWKMLKAILEEQGTVTDYPKQALVEAYSAKLIDDEKAWLKMIEDRNLTSHTYKKPLAKEIFKRIKSAHVKQFQKLKTRIDSE